MSTHENSSGVTPAGSDGSEQAAGKTLLKQGIIVGVIVVVMLIAALFGLI